MIRFVNKFLAIFRAPAPPPEPPMPIVIPVPARCRVKPRPKPCKHPKLSGLTSYRKGCHCARCRRAVNLKQRDLATARRAKVAAWKPGDPCCFPRMKPRWARFWHCPCPRCVAPGAGS